MGSLGIDQSSKKSAMWLYPKVLGFNPPERWGHSACYSHGVVYVFGGCCGGLHFSDVLKLNLETMVWSTLATTGQGPGPRDSHSAVLVGQKMIIFGGTNGSKKVNDLHILDLESKEWIKPECRGIPPSPRESHTATLVSGDKILIFGGSGEGEANYLNDLHVLDLKTMRWSSPSVRGDIPVPRDSHSTNVIGNKLIVYGGDCGDRYHGDIDVLDIDMLTWSKLAIQGSSPGVRAGHASVIIGNKVYIIGGVGDKHYYNDVWTLDMIASSWTQLNICGQQPQGRFSHTAIVTDSDVAIYGGCGEDERPLNELLVLQLGAEHPNGRYNISMCKIFGNHWIQSRRRFSQQVENNSLTMSLGNNESEPKQSIRFTSDTLHPKKRRTTNSANAWEIELEQEEHSLSLSQHSSPSQSDQEQTPVRRASESVTASLGFPLFKQFRNNSQPEHVTSCNQKKEPRYMMQRTAQDHQFIRDHQSHQKHDQHPHVVHSNRQGMQHPAMEHKPFEPAGTVQNLIGANVRGKVDGAFDSGLLMTANVNGKIFRGVLFVPGTFPGTISRGSTMLAQSQSPSPTSSSHFVVASHSLSKSNHIEPSSKPSHQQMSRQLPMVKAPPSLGKEPKLRSDLQGVVLTLGGPGSGVP